MRSSNAKRAAFAGAVTTMIITGAVFAAGPASAEGSQNCTGHSFGTCMYWASGEGGARADTLGNVWNYGVNPDSPSCSGAAGCSPYYFSWAGWSGNTSGLGTVVKNNSQSACGDGNNVINVYIYYNSGYQGSSDLINGTGCIDLYHTINNNTSQTMN